ncbi:hypothetical protein D3C76_1713590 [compost metagenome]
MAGFKRGFSQCFVADRRRVDIRLMGQIHEVIDHQSIIRLNLSHAAITCPVGIIKPSEIRDQIRIRQRGVARPDPHEAMTFLHGV